MESTKEKNVERIVNKAMKASKIDQAPSNFTSNVMSQIELLEVQKLKHPPLISQSKWVFILLCVLALIASSYFLNFESQYTYFDGLKEQLNFNKFSFQIFSNMRLSSVLLYGILMFGILFGVQLSLIKNYYLKHYNS